MPPYSTTPDADPAQLYQDVLVAIDASRNLNNGHPSSLALWIAALGLFVIGWILQFVGHYFEGKPPEFFKDYRFLFVGLRWWFKKIVGVK